MPLTHTLLPVHSRLHSLAFLRPCATAQLIVQQQRVLGGRVCGESFGMSPRALQVCRGFAEVSIDSTEINNERKRAAFAWRWNELICPEAAME